MIVAVSTRKLRRIAEKLTAPLFAGSAPRPVAFCNWAKINHDGGGNVHRARRNLPRSLEPNSLMAGEAGELKGLRDPPQAWSFTEAGLFLLAPRRL
jgi:hypothetical protein